MIGPFAWLQANPSATEAALAEVQLDGKPLPDALLADPLKLLDFGKATVIEAVRRDAPDGVVEALMRSVRRMTRFRDQLDQYQHVITTLAQAQGLRDRWELEPVLTQALASAPDEANRQLLQRALDVVARSGSADVVVAQADDIILGPDGGTTELSPGTQCAICCGLGCLACKGGCLVCCIVACITCGS